ncbi:MAG TPA: hypothetical protein VD860_08620 [Azospirillum sp.]|nr:hypothetical protein [Azospirillum sp.]
MTAPRKVDLWALTAWAIGSQLAGDSDGIALFDAERVAAGHTLVRSSLDGCALLSRRGDLGCQIDGSAPARGMAPRVHTDAEAVADGIERLRNRARRTADTARMTLRAAPDDEQARDRLHRAEADLRGLRLVVDHARQREQPGWIDPRWQQRLEPLPARSGAGRGVRYRVDGEWRDTPHKSQIARACIRAGQPILDAHGRSLLDRTERGFSFRVLADGTRQVLVKWSPVAPSPSDAYIRAVNAAYSEWHAGMMKLLGELLDVRLRDHAITGFAAQARPWEA